MLALATLALATALAAGPVGFVRYLDRTEGAFLVHVPVGWLTEGGMVRVAPDAAGGPGQSIEAKLDFAVKREREGRVMIRWIPHLNHIVPAPGIVTPSVGGLPVAPMPTPRDFAVGRLLPWLRPRAGGVKVEGVEARPDVVQVVQAGPKAQSLRSAGALHRVDAAAVTVSYDEGGTRYREVLFVAVEGFSAFGTAMWSNAFTIAARAPAAEFTAWDKVARVVVNSFALNPAWVEGELRGQAYRADVAARTQEHIARIDREIAEHRDRTRSAIQHQSYLNLTGQEQWKNPHTGRVELGSNAWKYRWQDASGRVFYTDDGTWDPRSDPALHATGFERSAQVPVR